MIIFNKSKLPELWERTSLDTVVVLNPKLDKSQYIDDLLISFVPMPAVEAESGKIDVSQIKKFADVKKGYTAFQENDVLFAKITPCMENGKMAIAPSLTNKLGFGSTEFHVLRSYEGILPKYIYYYVSSKLLRIEAEHNMTGAVGQRRVPIQWLGNVEFPIPSTNEQNRIVSKIDELFSELDKGIESLKTAREQLKVYRQALLKHAFEGKLTEQWRKDNADKLETAEQLLERIKQEREEHYQLQLVDWKEAVEQWETKGKEEKKPRKPASPKVVEDITDDEQSKLFLLPKEYKWCRFGNVYAESVLGKMLDKKKNKGNLKPYLRNINVRWGRFELSNVLEMRFEEHELERYVVSKDDLVICEGGEPGRCAIWENNEQGFLIQKALHRVKLLKNSLNSKYIYYFILFSAAQGLLSNYFTGTTIKHLTGVSLSKLPIPLSSFSEQRRIVQLLDELLSVIENNEKEIEDNLIRSELLRQSILKKAFSGKLVPQDQNDEPASELLKRIAQEKAELEAQEKADKAATKKTKPKSKRKKVTTKIV